MRVMPAWLALCCVAGVLVAVRCWWRWGVGGGEMLVGVLVEVGCWWRLGGGGEMAESLRCRKWLCRR